MDKKEYKNIFEAVKTHTGKEVEFLGDAPDKSKKEKKENDTKRVADVQSWRAGCEPISLRLRWRSSWRAI